MVKNTTLKNKNKLLNTKEKPSRFKRFLNHPLAIPASLLLVFCIYMILGWYTPRPLTKDFTYVGREYNSGCIAVPFFRSFGCFSSEYEMYYYATDVAPEEFASRFEGWKTKSIDNSGLHTNSMSYVYVEKRNGQDIGYTSVNYLKNQDKTRKDNLLLPIHKKYLVGVSPGIRDDLLSAD